MAYTRPQNPKKNTIDPPQRHSREAVAALLKDLRHRLYSKTKTQSIASAKIPEQKASPSSGFENSSLNEVTLASYVPRVNGGNSYAGGVCKWERFFSHFSGEMVRIAGLEPARIAPLPPQSSVSANSTICAQTVYLSSELRR